MEEKEEVKLDSKKENNALVGFILGLVSIIAWIIPIFGYPVTIIGIVFSAKGMSSTKNRSKAIAGLVLSIIFLIFTLINSIAGVLMRTSLY